MRANSFQLIKFCCTLTVPAAETKSIGLQANARVVMGFARHFDNFIVTRKSCPLIGTTPSGQFHRDPKCLSTYRDCKNACQSGYRWQQTIRPGH
jgi:hypothetical protein